METKNIWCVGQNYKKHAQELNNPLPSKPLIFLKAGSCLVRNCSSFKLPEWSQDLHFETEIGLRFDENLNISSYCLALDLTARDIQTAAKSKGHPWTLAKSFKESCPISSFVTLNSLQELEELSFQMQLNGQLAQNGFIKDMIFSPKTLIDYLLIHFPVEPGDLLLTGTPEGVGQLSSGDKIEIQDSADNKINWQVH